MILAFSLLRNWPRLFQPDYRSRPPIDRLKGLDGIRAILMILLVTGHSFIPYAMAISNPHFVEQVYYFLPYHVFINGAVIVQAFFLMSGILLSYSLQKTADKKTINWTMLISNIWTRWLRLTPSFAVILAFTSTLLRFISSGPLVQLLEVTEIEDCRSSWMWNFFYLRNYKYDSQCMNQTWYLAADLHLYAIGMMIFVLIRNTNWRNLVLAILFIIGVALTGLVTYFYDLTFLMAVSPRSLMRLFIEDPAYNYLYTPSHTNIPSFVMGLALGILIYNLQKREFNLEIYKLL
ncbi:PREDICTED: nose resistant to fluoxetine protein 6-like [Papilio xuthus]|uniref:Nose resistant to fluoxetine protein 6-like n=1 Tax=Papilio xuthus TaxID=66420 RepID=A0AAJ6Z0A1_PAPXU|nr:PREDICTED: nose resistant to fluoxetine protein 6-like [Papilio xuthus]